MSSQEFTCGAHNNFSSIVDSFRKHIFCFGIPGRELLTLVRSPPRKPLPDDVDLHTGKRLYALDSIYMSCQIVGIGGTVHILHFIEKFSSNIRKIRRR